MGLSFEFTLLAVGVLAYALVLAILRTLAGRLLLTLRRHDLLLESRRRRIAFHQEIKAQQEADHAANDSAAYDVDVIEDEEPARAAA